MINRERVSGELEEVFSVLGSTRNVAGAHISSQTFRFNILTIGLHSENQPRAKL